MNRNATLQWARILLGLVILLGLLGGTAAAARTPAESAAARIDAYIAQVRATVPIPGVAIAVMDSQGPVYVQGYGQAAPGRAVTPDTPFWIASLSKPITALAIWQLIHAGQLELEAPVQAYIPWFTLADPQAAARIRLRHLLEHTSGIPSLAGNDVYFDASPRDTPESLVRDLKDVMPTQQGLMQYSNYNYVVLGYLLEQVTGQTYAAYVQEHVLDPLGMVHTHFSVQAAKADGAVSGYRLLYGRPIPWDEPYKPAMLGAGYILSSAADMGRFAQLYLTDGRVGGQSLLGAEPDSAEGYYSIYWQWIGGASHRGKPEHGGAMQTTSTAMRIDPKRNLAIVVLLNCRPDGYYNNLNATTILDNVAAILAGGEPDAPDDRGWREAVRAMNLQMGTYLAAGIVSLGLTLLWRKRGLPLRWPRFAAALAAVAESALVLYGLVGTPLQTETPWPRLLQSAPDLYGSIWVLAGLYTISLALKVSTLWGLRQKPHQSRPRVAPAWSGSRVVAPAANPEPGSRKTSSGP
jgi:CubicO group peptidase (beta-lactamase class C family)